MSDSFDEIIVEDPLEGRIPQMMKSDYFSSAAAAAAAAVEVVAVEDVENEFEKDSEELHLHLTDLLLQLLEFQSIRSRGKRSSLVRELVANIIETIISKSMANPDDPRRKEFKELEEKKIAIDEKANALVRRELWAGLGFLFIQTAAFIVLTFWKLTWVVMEPIWFSVTSIYAIAGYAFFLRTSRDPSFESFYESRFRAKQKWLMKNKNFDITRFNELRRACYSF